MASPQEGEGGDRARAQGAQALAGRARLDHGGEGEREEEERDGKTGMSSVAPGQ